MYGECRRKRVQRCRLRGAAKLTILDVILPVDVLGGCRISLGKDIPKPRPHVRVSNEREEIGRLQATFARSGSIREPMMAHRGSYQQLAARGLQLRLK